MRKPGLVYQGLLQGETLREYKGDRYNDGWMGGKWKVREKTEKCEEEEQESKRNKNKKEEDRK